MNGVLWLSQINQCDLPGGYMNCVDLAQSTN